MKRTTKKTTTTTRKPTRKRIGGACNKRITRTRDEMDVIRQAILDVIEDDPPMTVRQVFYQSVSRGVIEKTELQYQRTVIRLMIDMRLDGRLPYDWVVDNGRQVQNTQTFDNVQDAIENTAQFYRRSALAQSDSYVEIWCEKDALAGVLYDVTSDYDVPLMVSRGMPSLTFVHSTAQEVRKAHQHGKRTYIYQFGYDDPTGVAIPKSLEKADRDDKLRCPPPTVKRAALTGSADQALPAADPADQARGQSGTPSISKARVSNLMRFRHGCCATWCAR